MKLDEKFGQRTVMAFDYGTKSIGVAIGQELSYSTKSLAALKAKDGIPNWDLIEKELNNWKPDLLLVGLPLNMDGTEQEITQRAKKFANRLHGRFGYPVETYDERLTTVDAKSYLFEVGGYRNLQKDKIDSKSAEIILMSWFEAQAC
ncbi:Holliday junction resolvase RuvX [Catenovulum maritimum]|jgi:putative Holliday junction resolvase|uniref:Putative pre-16S rRNA nuclease n=1 Tax=Catenovulum maritimum TaxID=1513271 RepID=A0A0J8GYT0_9ALTE|nr:Holliday junction resolvase RuvX [Catenovulum maritimum]KMT66394.1 Holliday junction resolvase [Catenovulum maritimum]